MSCRFLPPIVVTGNLCLVAPCVSVQDGGYFPRILFMNGDESVDKDLCVELVIALPLQGGW